MTRRLFQNLALFLTPLSYAAGFVTAAVKYLSPLPPPRKKPKLDVGPVTQFAGGVVKRFEFNGRDIFVLEEKGELIALDAQCTHLSCNVNWKPSLGCFLCPCHAGRFGRNGNVILKPPPAPLRRQKLIIKSERAILVDESPGGAA